MNSRKVESERYTGYFLPMPDIRNDTFPKKLKLDNMKEARIQEHTLS